MAARYHISTKISVFLSFVHMLGTPLVACSRMTLKRIEIYVDLQWFNMIYQAET